MGRELEADGEPSGYLIAGTALVRDVPVSLEM